MNVKFGLGELEYPSEQFKPLKVTHYDGQNIDHLKSTLSTDGYLYLPGFLPREVVLSARERVLTYMDEQRVLEPNEPALDGVMPAGGTGINLMGLKKVTHHPDVLRVLEAPELFELYSRLFGASPLTYDYKWLRAVGNERYTGSHFDWVYMGRGSQNVHTVWIPMGDTTIDHGTLAVVPGSQSSESFAKLRSTYGQMDVDRDHISGWFSENPKEIIDTFGGTWHTSDVQAGDIITFGLHLLHASTTNTTNRFRLSCDVRYQPEHEPVDERWLGEKARGHYRTKNEPVIPIEQAREKWGV